MFHISGCKEGLSIIIGAFRFAFSAILFSQFPFIVLNILPLKWKYHKVYQAFSNTLYYISAVAFFMANCIDVVYIQFSFKRLTFDIFQYVGVGGDFVKLIPVFLLDFWYVTLLFILSVTLFIWLAHKMQIKSPEHFSFRYYLKETGVGLCIVLLSFIGMRGGWQYRPLSIFHASMYSAKNPELVLNTPFTIEKTIGKTGLEKVSYFKDDDRLRNVFNPVRKYSNNVAKTDTLPNIVLIILESFSTEYMGCINGGLPSYTPFLDSLYEKSMTFRGLSNGKRSIEGIPAIISGVPQLMNEAFITSIYSGNQVSSIPEILKTKGYYSAFFHGGYNGTMGFDAFCKQAGFDDYYGMTAYDNPDDYDGNWGIFDEPFLQWTGKQLMHKKQPFFSVVYTLSSHHPYSIPSKYKGQFKKGTLNIHESIMYSDFALKKFFDSISRMPWFEHTVFIITADHAAQMETPEYKTSIGVYEIPMFVYIPAQSKGIHTKEVVQQIDLMPSIAHYIGYEKSFCAFGNSLFDTTANRYQISYLSGVYQLFHQGYILQFTENQAFSLKHDPENHASQMELIKKEPQRLKEEETFCKAIIQQYNNRMMNNKLKDTLY